jgi:arsenite methyltransferase
MIQKNALKADYGQDVPGMVRDTLAMGAFLTVLAALLRKWSQARESTIDPLISLLGLATTTIGVLSSLEGLALIFGSRVGKFIIRDTLPKSLRLQGNETVLDVGCGHGMFLIGAAKRLPQGKAVGIDLWSQVDQGGNRKAATIANAEIEGVKESS